jgi:TPP-dependent pyruvate/acetoin dehydrogenase alpha subunit
VLEGVAAEARKEMETAVKFAVEAGYPAAAQVSEDVYA